MKHTMIDCYSSNQSQLNDMMTVYNMLNDIAASLSAKAVTPPGLVPYYYCPDASDVGISAYLILEGGHITVHTFPMRECYFFDILYDGYYDVEKLKSMLSRYLPAEKTLVNETDRRFNSIEEKIPTTEDFGPHVLIKAKPESPPDMERMFKFLDTFPQKIGMDPIMRPLVLYSSSDNPRFLSGIVMIAQSHIAFHYNISGNFLMLDIFSCTAFNTAKLERVFKSYNLTGFEKVVIARGSKYSEQKLSEEIRIMRQKSWQLNSK